jgi:hypothetical protein
MFFIEKLMFLFIYALKIKPNNHLLGFIFRYILIKSVKRIMLNPLKSITFI